jgi:hypothetical protein
MQMASVVSVFKTPDGREFTNKADAMLHLQRPKIVAALMTVANGNKSLVEWLVDNRESVEIAFEAGTIRRVTKAETNKLRAALDAVVSDGNPKFKFVAENAGAILDSFRWPSVKRLTPEEKTAVARNSLMAATENNEQMVEWIIMNREAVLEGYDAGREKREINNKAVEALAAYRQMRAREKEEMENAEKEGAEAVKALLAARAAKKAADAEAAKAAAEEEK